MTNQTEIAKLRAEWEALPEGERKDDAEVNANETAGTAEDKARWFKVAIATYEMG